MLRRAAAWLGDPLLIGGGMTLGYELVVRGVAPAIVVGALGASAMVIVALLERVLPYVADWNRTRILFSQSPVLPARLCEFHLKVAVIHARIHRRGTGVARAAGTGADR